MEVSYLPEIGQIVTVRQRRYIVTDVCANPLPNGDGIDTGDTLVSMRSIEDNAGDETLQVIWEIEPDARINEKSGLPEPSGMDDPKKFNAFMNAVRWGAVSSMDDKILNAPYRSGISIENYQLEPLIRAIKMPRVNLLIADDVGLGKTIESGLIMQEMMLRGRIVNALIICPSSLQIQWKEQMREKFGLEFRIVDSALIRELRRTRGLHVNPWTHFPRLITSIDFLKRDRSISLFKKILPKEGESRYPRKFDFMIIDEAHNIAPSAGGKYAVSSLRTRAIRTLVPHFEHKLFLTATPHNGYQESFTALLEMLDNQRFARGITPDPAQQDLIMIRRMKSEILDDLGMPAFPARRVEEIPVDYSEEEKQAHKNLQAYIDLRLKNSKDEYERTASEFMAKILKKRMFSSPAAFRYTLEQHIDTLKKEKPTAVPRKPAFGILRQRLAEAEDEDDLYNDAGTSDEAEENPQNEAGKLFHDLTARENELLKELSHWAENASGRPDSKQLELLNWLNRTIRPNGQWSDERVIIFTEYRATQSALFNLLSRKNFTGHDRVLVLNGATDEKERERIKAAFQANPKVSPVRILLATDAASEGIDLQNHCHRMIHMEIPWNPNRLEQRNGRLDRHGQKHEVLTYHFVPKDYEERSRANPLADDLEFLLRAAKKLEQIREDLGKAGTVLSDEVQKAMLRGEGNLDRIQFGSTSPAAMEFRREQKQREQNQKRLQAERKAQLEATRDHLHISPENICSICSVALDLDGQLPLTETEIPDLPCKAYKMPNLTGSWAACLEGLEHPHTREQRPITFDTREYAGQDNVVLAHLNHRLVQKSMQLLRAEIWAPAGKKHLNRISACAAVKDPGSIVLLAFARIVVTGASHQRIYEEIISAGGLLCEGKLDRLNVTETEQMTDLITDRPVDASIKEKLLDYYQSHQTQVRAAIDARGKERNESIRKQLIKKAADEKQKIEAVLLELQRSIQTGLNEEDSVYQLELFNPDEKDELRQNLASLRARIAEIPAEIEEEKKRIDRMYSDPQMQIFPAGVIFLVPERMVRK